MKNKEKSTMTAVLLLSVLLIIVVYMFVYKSYADKTKDLQASNSTLQARVNELKVYYDDKETYEQELRSLQQILRINSVCSPEIHERKMLWI